MNQQTIDRIRKFTEDRDWEQFHSPANLAKSIVIEAAELLECFQWSDEEFDIQHVKEEIADVLVYSQNLLDKLGLNADEIINMKMDQNEATDGSKELCRIASKYTGTEVKQMLFQELAEIEKYDGIWACSSILHLPKTELLTVLKKMITALKDNGIIYTSFKYSEFEGKRNGRYFTDFTMDSFKEFIKNIDNISIEDYWITGGVRPGREEEKWLNLILRKTNF